MVFFIGVESYWAPLVLCALDVGEIGGGRAL